MIIRGATDRTVAAVGMTLLPAILGVQWLAWLGVIFGWPLLAVSWLCEEHGDQRGMAVGITLTVIYWGWLIYSSTN